MTILEPECDPPETHVRWVPSRIEASSTVPHHGDGSLRTRQPGSPR